MTTLVATPEPSALAKLLADPDRLRDFPIETVERLFVLDSRADSGRRREKGVQPRISTLVQARPLACSQAGGLTRTPVAPTLAWKT